MRLGSPVIEDVRDSSQHVGPCCESCIEEEWLVPDWTMWPLCCCKAANEASDWAYDRRLLP